MTESPKPDLPSWDDLDLPVLSDVVDETHVPTLSEEALDVPEFDFSSELDALQQSVAVPETGMAELEIPELTLEDLDVSPPSPGALDLGTLPSLDLSVPVAGELTLDDVLPDLGKPVRAEPPAAALFQPPAPVAIAQSMPEMPAVAVDGFEFTLDEEPGQTDSFAGMQVSWDAPAEPAAAAPVELVHHVAGESNVADGLDQLLSSLNALQGDVPPEEAVNHLLADAEPGDAVWPAPDNVLSLPHVEASHEAAHELASAGFAAEMPEAAASTPEEVLPVLSLEAHEAESVLPPQAAAGEPPEVAAGRQPAAETAQLVPESHAFSESHAVAGDLPTLEHAFDAGVSDMPAPIEHISLDSLPTGVLGGGLGLAAAYEAEAPTSAEPVLHHSLDEVLRAAEATLAEERKGMTPVPAVDAPDEDEWTPASEVDHQSETEDPLQEGLPQTGLERRVPDSLSAPSPQLLHPPHLDAAAPVAEEMRASEEWPAAHEVGRENEAETEAEAAPPAPVSMQVDTLFGESPFASERAAALQASSPLAPAHALPVAATPDALPVLGEEPAQDAAVELVPQDAPAEVEAPATPQAMLAEIDEPEPQALPILTEEAASDHVDVPFVLEAGVLAGGAMALAAAGVALVAGQDAVAQTDTARKGVSVLSVSAMCSQATSAQMMQPQSQDHTIAVVDEKALVDAMYEKLLPRMKVELSLWLQDALEMQAKSMLSGVMQQLKEDYDMLFGDTLRESLRQAIIALGREQQDEQDKREGKH